MKNKGRKQTVAGFARGSIGMLTLAALGSLVSIGFSFLTPQIIRLTVDNVIGSEPADTLPALLMGLLGGRETLRERLVLCGAAIAVTAALGGVFNGLGRVCVTRGTEKFSLRLRDALLRHVQALPYSWLGENRTGDIIQRCTADVETLHRFVSEQLIEVVRTVLLLAAALGIMFGMNGTLALVFAASVPVIVGYSLFFYRRIGRQFLYADECEGELLTDVQENLTAVRVVRAFGREKQELEKFDRIGAKYIDSWVRMGYTMGLFWGMGDMAVCLQMLAILCVGTLLVARGETSLGVLLAFISYTHTLASPVRQMGRSLSEMSKAKVSAARLQEILDAEPERDEPDASDVFPDGDIVFENVCFSYGGQEVLRDVSFRLPRGGTLGVLGATGSGKSTLTLLLTRLEEPDKGRITIGGRDIRTLRRDCLRRHVALVMQEPFLFSETIRENITAAAPDCAEEDMRRCARYAAVDEDILSFAEGYDTVVGERGVTLSGGQRQRVAIARALAAQSPVLVLDDAMSAVDMQTDQRIRQGLREAAGERTVLLISHRVSTLMEADRILVLEDGRVTECGTHRELMELGGHYARVCRIQESAAAAEGGQTA